MEDETVNQTWTGGGDPSTGRAMPGLVLVFSSGRACLHPLPLEATGLELGRGRVAGVDIGDGTLSRRHARVALADDVWQLEDLGSRNGSAVDGAVLQGAITSASARVLRCGDSLFLLERDVRPFIGGSVTVDGAMVSGPLLQRVWAAIDSAAHAGDVLHVTGETGAGKELAARRFHRAGPRRDGPFVAVNCATIPAALAERLLWGAKKGAFSGADADVDGYLQAAHRGTLFLDEVAELDLQVQAKLLRVLETHEVTPLGATAPRTITLSIVSATHGALRDRVDDGRFRADLFFRLGRPQVTLPPLRERLAELPHIVERALVDEGTAPHVSLVEAALTRAWPGNIRELLVELKEAARQARLAGAERVRAEHLPAEAGRAGPSRPPTTPTQTTTTTPTSTTPAATAPRRRAPNVEVPAREALVAALDAHDGNISHAAAALGVHRTQLRRWMDKHGIAARSTTTTR